MERYYVPILHWMDIDSFTYISSDCAFTSVYKKEKKTQHIHLIIVICQKLRVQKDLF